MHNFCYMMLIDLKPRLLQALDVRGELGISLLPSPIQLGYLTLHTIELPLEFGLSLGSFGLPLIARFRHRTRGITCALKSTGVVHSQQASLRQDIAPRRVWKLARVLLEVPDGVLDPLGFPFLASGITHADSRLNLEILFPYMEEIR
ncbi:hypothetical protein F2Q69_00023330 [Brassica cretica]|uniref:Uncharacterized protein n=1 Tax=Brassica cretica TaxID=69181 RepID=A0A8S9QL36_BRACR|nr:hypothetical protein F2Q69_00023330 [Brassica cretica]